jgi:tetratricopeptide (TPR) repeat protein
VAKPGFVVSKTHRDLISEVRNVRVMEAIAEVLTDFQSKMGSDKFRSEPLALLKRILREQKLDKASAQSLEKALRGLTVSNPGWSEPWLELGFLLEDQGRLDEALTCFANATTGLQPSDLPDRDPHPSAIAGARRGKLLIEAGNDTEARACFELSLGYNPDQRTVAVEYANLLRRLGHFDQALVHYCEGMYYQESRWSVPVPPRDAERLRFPHLTGRMQEIREPGFPP